MHKLFIDDLDWLLTQKPELMSIIFDLIGEYCEATRKYKQFNSAYEGYAILLEEMDELWEEVKKKQNEHDLVAMKKEANQIATMAVRFIVDVCAKK